MPAVALLLKLNGEQVVRALQEAGEKLESGNGQIVLEFSAVTRIDPPALTAMEQLAGVAQGKGVRLALRGVNIEVYKVLKLAKLAREFSFLS